MALPPTSFGAPWGPRSWGVPSDSPTGKPEFTSHPLLRFRSPSEFYQSVPPQDSAQRRYQHGASHEVFAPTASSAIGVHFPGFAWPGTFRSQVFSTSQRLTPPTTSRVYFTPMTLLGFHPPELSPPRKPDALPNVRYPLGVTFLCNRPPRIVDCQAPVISDLGFENHKTCRPPSGPSSCMELVRTVRFYS